MKSGVLLGCFTIVLMSIAIVNGQENAVVGSVSYKCYDILNANLDSLLEVYKAYATTCVNNANAKRNTNVGVTDTGSLRSQLENIMAGVTKYFNECSLQQGYYFYTCLAGHFDYYNNTLIQLRNMVINALNTNKFDDSSSINTSGIDEEERQCVAAAVAYHKSESERFHQLFSDCVTNGFRI